MSIIKSTIILLFLVMNFTSLHAQEIKKIGKFKDWETIVVTDDSAKLASLNLNQFYNPQKII